MYESSTINLFYTNILFYSSFSIHVFHEYASPTLNKGLQTIGYHESSRTKVNLILLSLLFARISDHARHNSFGGLFGILRNWRNSKCEKKSSWWRTFGLLGGPFGRYLTGPNGLTVINPFLSDFKLQIQG